MPETHTERVTLYIAVYAERYGRTLSWGLAAERCGVPGLADPSQLPGWLGVAA